MENTSLSGERIKKQTTLTKKIRVASKENPMIGSWPDYLPKELKKILDKLKDEKKE